MAILLSAAFLMPNQLRQSNSRCYTNAEFLFIWPSFQSHFRVGHVYLKREHLNTTGAGFLLPNARRVAKPTAQSTEQNSQH